jgi:predicted GTPase
MERRTIVVVGTTGTGKSTLANVLLGLSVSPNEPFYRRFKMSSGARSCTVACSSLDGFWLGDRSKPIRVIDTPGHGDGDGNDFNLLQSIVQTMRAERAVHAFIWVKNSEAPRVDALDIEFLNIFLQVFGPGFVRNMAVVFTR